MVEEPDFCNPEQKILVLGLANSGKTSIILSLKGVNNLLSYYSLKPTKGVDINEIDDPFSGQKYFVWDFGGQDLFRKRHLNELDKMSVGACKLIYVIDSQDYEKYGATFAFLQDILNFNFTKNMSIIVYLHKYDPEIENNPNNDINQKLSEFIPRIHKLLKGGWDYKVFKTSIFTQFRKMDS